MKQQTAGKWRRSARLISPVVLLLAFSLPAVAGEIGGSVAATTDYVYRGLTQSDSGPALQADLHYRGTGRWVVGVWGSTVDYPAPRRGSYELDVYAGFDWTLSRDWDARIGLTHYFYPDASAALRYDYDEIAGSLTWQSRVSATVAWSPDITRRVGNWVAEHDDAASYELTATQPLPGRFSDGRLSAVIGVGYYDLPEVLRADYVFWNMGLNFALGKAQLGLMYIDTDGVASRAFGYKAAVNGFTGSVAWRF